MFKMIFLKQSDGSVLGPEQTLNQSNQIKINQNGSTIYMYSIPVLSIVYTYTTYSIPVSVYIYT